MTILKIKVMNSELEDLYKNSTHSHDGDSGIDLYTPHEVTIHWGETKFIDLEIQCEMINENGHSISYQLVPRSSISKTPLILHNSIGIIDAGYRGNIKAAIKYIPTPSDIDEYMNQKKINTYTIPKGTRLFQICKFTGEPFHLQLVETLSESSRGSGGFGSTGQ